MQEGRYKVLNVCFFGLFFNILMFGIFYLIKYYEVKKYIMICSILLILKILQ
jgi:hypothetical protein